MVFALDTKRNIPKFSTVAGALKVTASVPGKKSDNEEQKYHQGS